MQNITELWWLWLILSIPYFLVHYKLRNSGKSLGGEAATLSIGLLLIMMAFVSIIATILK